MELYGDLHCDTLWKCYRHQSDLDDPSLNIRRNPPFKHLQTYAVYIPDGTKDSYEYFRAVHTYGEELMRRYPEMHLCHSGKEIDETFAAGQTPYIYSVEGGGFFDEDMLKNERIAKELKKRGVVFISLCYNEGNHLAGGINAEFGMSDLGKKVALLLRENGLTVDISHLNHRSADQMLELLPDHVVATHSNCYALKAHPRNLTDEQIKELIDRKGLMGVNFCHHFLSAPDDAKISDLIDHFRHILNLGGQSVAAIGGDFDGISRVPADLPDLYTVAALGDALEREFGAEITRKILYGNMKNYIDRII